MSWREGSQLFHEFWPLLRTRIPNKSLRRDFVTELLKAFLKFDIDPENISDVHAEVREALERLGVSTPPPPEGDDVAICIRQLKSRVEKERLTAAQAMEFSVNQAENPSEAASQALAALAHSLKDTNLKVRRAASGSIVDLLAEGFTLPKKCLPALKSALKDEDKVVRGWVEQALKRVC